MKKKNRGENYFEHFENQNFRKIIKIPLVLDRPCAAGARSVAVIRFSSINPWIPIHVDHTLPNVSVFFHIFIWKKVYIENYFKPRHKKGIYFSGEKKGIYMKLKILNQNNAFLKVKKWTTMSKSPKFSACGGPNKTKRKNILI